MLDWVKQLVRARILPDDPATPARVDFVGRILSPNTCTSPITSLSAALLEIVLVDWETLVVGGGSLAGPREYERFTPLGGVRYGNGLVVADDHGRELYIESATAPRVMPLSSRPMVLDQQAPPELRDAARLSRHMLSYRETRFREGDRVRVIATVTGGQVAPQPGIMRGFAKSGYRDGLARVLVTVDGERLELHETL
jgi:hypothetical protein